VTDFRALIEALGRSDVRFVLVGGVAATVHGSARLTQDVDIVYSRDPENLKRLALALAPLGPYLRGAPPGLPFRLDEGTLAAGLNFTLTTSVRPAAGSRSGGRAACHSGREDAPLTAIRSARNQC
jgi:hypothetical protein